MQFVIIIVLPTLRLWVLGGGEPGCTGSQVAQDGGRALLHNELSGELQRAVSQVQGSERGHVP